MKVTTHKNLSLLAIIFFILMLVATILFEWPVKSASKPLYGICAFLCVMRLGNLIFENSSE